MNDAGALKVTTPTDREIVLTRAFDAPRRLVFDAWTRPELLRRWHGARGWNLVVCEVDLRVGGRWRFVSRGPGGEEMGQSGVYRVVSPPDRLVHTEVFDDQSYPGETLVTHEFAERDGRTTLTSTVLYATREGRDIVLAYPMARGVAESYERLAEALARVGPRAGHRRSGHDDPRAGTGPEPRTRKQTIMNWTLEVVVVPVSDVDRAKTFYAERLGFTVDHDTRFGDEVRIVQLTPPGSGCSIVIGRGAVPDMPPGSLRGLQLVVPDIHRARAELAGRGVEVGEVQILGENPRPVPDPLDNVGFFFFSDPDGNGWAVQQISERG